MDVGPGVLLVEVPNGAGPPTPVAVPVPGGRDPETLHPAGLEALRLAAVFHVTENGTNGGPITGETMARAVAAASEWWDLQAAS